MLDIKKWKKMDIVYVILSMAVSIVIVNVVLIQHSGLFSKSIMFIIVSVLIYFLIKYIHDYKKISVNPDDHIIEDLKTKKEKDEKQTTDKQTTDKQTTDKQTTDKQTTGKQTTDKQTTGKQTTKENVIEGFDTNSHNSGMVGGNHDNDTKLYTKLQGQSEQSNPSNTVKPVDTQSTQYSNIPHLDNSTLDEEDNSTLDEEDSSTLDEDNNFSLEETDISNSGKDDKSSLEDTDIDHSYPPSLGASKLKGGGLLSDKKRFNTSRDLPKHTYTSKVNKPYDTPININISYNTKSSTNTDDIISIKERFSKPDESTHIFHENKPLPIPNNMKINTPLQHRDTGRGDPVTAIGSKRHGYVSHSQPLLKDNQAYSGHNYEYIHPSIGDHHMKNKKKEACPININKNWSAWDPLYLSGDDTNENMNNT